jgi:tetratricopeptide (TPR) repeat protein
MGGFATDVQWIFKDALRHHCAGRLEQAVTRYKRALLLKPNYAEAHNNLGVVLATQGRVDDAVARYRRALSLKPDSADAHCNLGAALVTKGTIAEGITHYEHALFVNPEYANAHNNLGVALAKQGRIEQAVARYQRAISLKPDFADAHNNLGNALAAQGNHHEAIMHYERALAINPDHADAHNNLGIMFRHQGRFDDAMAHYGRALAIRPDHAEAHFHRAEIKTFRRGDADLATLKALAGKAALPEMKAPFIHFALAKGLEDIGDYKGAFKHLRRGNDSKRKQIDFDEPRDAAMFERISRVFDGGLFNRLQGMGAPSSMPIFVLGMPRSGSTLIEQVLAGHPQIQSGGELEHMERAASTVSNSGPRALPFPDCISALDGAALRRIGEAYLARLPVLADGKVRIVDKLPDNFLRIGLIRLILPNARIIHTVRDPIDTCVSCYSRLFTSGQGFSYELAELGRYYGRYRNLMAHWGSVLPPDAMLDVVYEDVVNDLEGQARRLIDYCGLPWDDRCVSFNSSGRTVKTASGVQVRKPLFRSSLQRWRKYNDGIGPLLQALAN